MQYKIIYHLGDAIGLKTKVERGVLILDREGFRITGPGATIQVPFTSMQVKLFRLHGLGRMIKVICRDRTLFVTVVRLNLLGYFIISNFLAAGELYEKLKQGTSLCIHQPS